MVQQDVRIIGRHESMQGCMRGNRSELGVTEIRLTKLLLQLQQLISVLQRDMVISSKLLFLSTYGSQMMHILHVVASIDCEVEGAWPANYVLLECLEH